MIEGTDGSHETKFDAWNRPGILERLRRPPGIRPREGKTDVWHANGQCQDKMKNLDRAVAIRTRKPSMTVRKAKAVPMRARV